MSLCWFSMLWGNPKFDEQNPHRGNSIRNPQTLNPKGNPVLHGGFSGGCYRAPGMCGDDMGIRGFSEEFIKFLGFRVSCLGLRV